ncbi:hypothetical protein FIBSPDRAFT_975902 [Athelia psychrophila]|uniref:Uncharacterized protein n=1 Tax=Athelia psychrophila TaxID=1759441 RepID=A0A166F657_9AGAM|nr:hypothetical protein FIBSPDRAFT_975902 [Fibularhizoctonia sp. CBS 109695]
MKELDCERTLVAQARRSSVELPTLKHHNVMSHFGFFRPLHATHPRATRWKEYPFNFDAGTGWEEGHHYEDARNPASKKGKVPSIAPMMTVNWGRALCGKKENNLDKEYGALRLTNGRPETVKVQIATISQRPQNLQAGHSWKFLRFRKNVMIWVILNG